MFFSAERGRKTEKNNERGELVGKGYVGRLKETSETRLNVSPLPSVRPMIPANYLGSSGILAKCKELAKTKGKKAGCRHKNIKRLGIVPGFRKILCDKPTDTPLYQCMDCKEVIVASFRKPGKRE